MKGFTIRLEALGFGRDPREYAEFVRNGLRNLTMANVWAYRSDPLLPSIYDAGVEYRREPPRNEQFKDVVAVLRDKHGDCEDLACAVAAWRRVRTGEAAHPSVTWKPLDAARTRWLYHITVERPGLPNEDPSKRLGMGNEPGRWVQRGRLWVYELFPGRRGVVPKPVPVVERKNAA